MEMISATRKKDRDRFKALSERPDLYALIHTLEMPPGMFGVFPAGTDIHEAIKLYLEVRDG